jgi:hypothetical protein
MGLMVSVSRGEGVSLASMVVGVASGAAIMVVGVEEARGAGAVINDSGVLFAGRVATGARTGAHADKNIMKDNIQKPKKVFMAKVW